MQERQVTIDGETLKLSPPFMTLATQNPVEHEGTYPLPEAQLDRFMMKVLIEYPVRETSAKSSPAPPRKRPGVQDYGCFRGLRTAGNRGRATSDRRHAGGAGSRRPMPWRWPKRPASPVHLARRGHAWCDQPS